MAFSLIPFPFSISTLRASLVVFLLFGLFFLPAVQSDSVFIRPPPDPCGNYNESDNAPLYCPVKCFRTDPVCGDDGVTYWCGCEEARCAAAKVARLGFCEVRNNGGAAAQALLLIHIVWLIMLGFSVFFGLL